LKVGIITPYFDRRGGAEHRTAALVAGLKGLGHEVHLLASRWHSDLISGLHCHRVSLLPLSAAIKLRSFTWFARRTAKRLHLDITHSQGRTWGEEVATLSGGCHRAYLESLVEEAADARAVLWHDPFHKAVLEIESRQYQACRRIIVLSQWSREGLLRYFPEVASKVVVVHNGVDCDHFNPHHRERWRTSTRAELKLAEEQTCFLFLGTGFARKGLAEAITAIAQGSTGETVITVIGAGDKAPYQRLSTQLGIGERVRFLGSVGDPRPYLAAADALLIPSYFEPFGNAFLEAMASGLPVVLTRTCGASEIITHGQEGFLADTAYDQQALAEAVHALLDPELRQRMGTAARAAAEAHPWSRSVEATVAVYREILAEKGKTGVA